MGPTIRYTREELLHLRKTPLVQEPTWLITKKRLIGKLYQDPLDMLGGLAERMKEETSYIDSIQHSKEQMLKEYDETWENIKTVREISLKLGRRYQDVPQHVREINNCAIANFTRRQLALPEDGLQPFHCIISSMIASRIESADCTAVDYEVEKLHDLISQHNKSTEATNKAWDDKKRALDRFHGFSRRYNIAYMELCIEAHKKVDVFEHDHRALDAALPSNQVLKTLTQGRMELEREHKIIKEHVKGLGHFDHLLQDEIKITGDAESHYRRFENMFERFKRQNLVEEFSKISDTMEENAAGQRGVNITSKT